MGHHRVIGSLVLLGCVASGACASDEVTRDPIAVRDSAGIQIVENGDPPSPLAWRVSADPTARIGSSTEGSDGPLYRVVGVARLQDGGIAVANAGSYEIRLYGSDGALRRVVGGEGRGPSEFMDISGMVVGAGDTIHVFDDVNQRITVFTSGGDMVEDRSVPTDAGVLSTLVAKSYEGFVMLPRNGHDAGTASDVRQWRDSTRFVLLQGEEVAPIPLHSWVEMWETPTSYGWVTFGGSDLTAFQSDGVREADGYDGSVVFRSIDGGIRRIARWPADATDFSSGDMLGAAREMGAPQDQIVEMQRQLGEEGYRYPDSVQAYDEQVIDARGVSWFRRFRLPWQDPPDGGDRWDLIGADGRMLGYIALPPGFLPFDIGEGYLLGVWTSPLGSEEVRLYELERDGTLGINAAPN